MVNYREAGVDSEAGYEVVKRVKKLVKGATSKNVLGEIGAFGAMFSLKGLKLKDPVLVSGADGVGTKVKIACLMGKHDTIGIDLVAMNVDDVVTAGAKPLFFLDYIGCNQVSPPVLEEVLKGVVAGCKQADCSLIGGETAELGDIYQPGEYDLAGFAVGAVEKKAIIDTAGIKPGDVIVGLMSSGLHSNGYSLARKIVFEIAGMKVSDPLTDLGKTIGEELLIPTRIYARSILKLIKKIKVKGLAHITGGGLPGNVSRILPKGTKAVIDNQAWEIPPIFRILQRYGRVAAKEMFKTFNMGIGMTVVVAAKDATKTVKFLDSLGEQAYIIGEIVKGKGDVGIV